MKGWITFREGGGPRSWACAWLLCSLGAAGPWPARAAAQTARPQLLADVGIDQKLDQPIPLGLEFRDETGKTVQLGQYFGQKPVLLALVYYECPMLCTQVLNGLLRSLQGIPLTAGKQFTVVTVSINPREQPALAGAKKRLYLGLYSRPGSEEGWHFLTGGQASIERLAQAVGFRYAYDRESGQYAHAAGIAVLTPKGRLSRYLYGIAFPSRDLRLALVEASANKIASPVDQILLFCYHYDPTTGKYGLVILSLVRAVSLATVLALGTFLVLMFRRERAG